jgi:tetratricopeptide (TPR) repeat protein
MIRNMPKMTVSVTKEKRIRMVVGSKTREVSLDGALSYAYWLIKAGHYGPAATICAPVIQFASHAARAAILLARCEAGLRNYAASDRILHSRFATQDAPLAEELQAAFVYDSLGLHRDAVHELAAVAQAHPDLPTVCLLLGDWYARLGYRDRAIACWKAAIQRDRQNGSAAQAALGELARLQEAR